MRVVTDQEVELRAEFSKKWALASGFDKVGRTREADLAGLGSPLL